MPTIDYESPQTHHAPHLTKAAHTPVVQTVPAQRSLWWVLWLTLAVLAIGALIVYIYIATGQGQTPTTGRGAGGGRGLPVVAAIATTGDLPIYLEGLGTVTPFYTVTIKSRVDGQIMNVLFQEGQSVKQDQPLIEIDPRPYQAMLTQAQGQLAKDQAEFQAAKVTVDRDKQAMNAISKQQLDTDTATMNQYAGAIEIDRGQIDTANLNLVYSHITSPITGKIGLRLVDPGNIVHATDTTGLAVVTQLQPIAVVFPLAEDVIDQVQKRMAKGGSIEVDAYSRDEKSKLATGKLIAIDNQIDPNSGTVKLKASFDNTDNALFPQQFVNAKILVNMIKHTVLVPTAAIQHSPQGTFVYVVKKEDPTTRPVTAENTTPTTSPSEPQATVELRTVTVGHNETFGPNNIDMTSVESGLEAGDIVVTDGVDKLQDGSKVIPRISQPATTNPSTLPAATTQPHHHQRSE